MMKLVSHISRSIVKIARQPISIGLSIILSSLLAVFIFILVQPRFSVLFIPGLYRFRIEQFVQQSITANSINPWQHWRLRDFAVIDGSILLTEKFPEASTSANAQELSSILAVPDHLSIFSLFSSNQINSLEGTIQFAQNDRLSSIINQEWLSDSKILLTNDKNLIIRSDDDVIYTMFIQPVETMATVNGYLHFQYRDTEYKKNVEGSEWLTMTRFNL